MRINKCEISKWREIDHRGGKTLRFLRLKELRGWHAGSVMDAAGAEPSEGCIERLLGRVDKQIAPALAPYRSLDFTKALTLTRKTSRSRDEC